MSVKSKRWMSFAVLLVVVAAASYSIYANGRGSGGGGIRTGQPAPEFTVADMSGKQVKLSDYRGKGVLLNFWGSWCEPCVNEMPRLNEAYRASIPDVDVIGVNVGQSRGTVKEFAAANGLDFPLFTDAGGEAAKAYQVSGLPATFLIDADGNLAKVVTGELISAEQVKELLRSVAPTDG
ncbi:redoxin domain-containing protein [Paenibacillus contaminans]|uniref:Thiol-disulfide oxidoreductase ResA n=1 Tax=Paenibacillus contaminans TaxID=450362 RepID=A0A329MTJ0_9BACL|nr:redoxin domain-containing protein [Paenibacillus contaminans]RAV22860.1 thiol-disulfide oxidoreductase ResA [Paenibacillus contaminans]